MSFLKKLFVVAMALTLVVPGSYATISDANAQSNENANATSNIDSVSGKFEQMKDTANKSSEIKNSKQIQKLKDISNAAISSNQVVVNASNSELVIDNAKFIEIKEEKVKYKTVTIPIVGDQYSFISNLTLIFDSKNSLISYSETLITKNDNNKFVVTSYSNGNLLQKDETDIDYVSNNTLKKELKVMQNSANGIVAPQKSFSKTVLCISTVALIDLTVARLIAATCVASCPGIPPICAACIGAVAVVGAGNLGAIMACFK
ncbi:hypothetical protein U9J35_04175 [Rossellomorea aquimaris]|nr:hypothetical protein [Rossellomorea aquimaris]WRP07373.1 hypothetical protein U9J35_04175 [Rossellomorea aquimaris]